MKKYLLIVLMLLACVKLGYAVEVSVDESFVSRYIFRGQDVYSNNDPAQQVSIDMLFKDIKGIDFGFNIWGSLPLNKGHEDLEELDYTVSASKEVSDNLSVSGGVTYFDYPNTTSRADIVESWASLAIGIIEGLNLNLFAGYDFAACSGGPDEGWYYSFGLEKEFALDEGLFTQDDQKLILSVTNWGNDGAYDLKPSFVYASEVSLTTEYLFKDFSISPLFGYVLNYEDEINSGKDEIYTGISFGYSF